MSVPSSFDLSGRVALVTGSARAIGRAMALALAGQGATVAIHDIAAGPDSDATVAEACKLGARAEFFEADFMSADAPARLVRDVAAALGPPDILVISASIEIRQPWLAIDPASFDAQVAVNFRATLSLLQAAAPAMIEKGWGRIVTIGSIQEERPLPDLMVYAALKSAQTNMAVNLARQIGGRGVTVNNIAPGAIHTNRNAHVLSDETTRARVESLIPVGRLGAPDDIVGACLLLCSDAGRYINGATLFVDGGWHRS